MQFNTSHLPLNRQRRQQRRLRLLEHQLYQLQGKTALDQRLLRLVRRLDRYPIDSRFCDISNNGCCYSGTLRSVNTKITDVLSLPTVQE
jgi:hypothetical protein